MLPDFTMNPVLEIQFTKNVSPIIALALRDSL